MAAVSTRGNFDHLIQITNLHSPVTFWRRLVAETGKNAILIEPSLCSPIGMVKIIKNLVPLVNAETIIK